jgi:alkanesulfonate monooxygenase SsuD/methylene tetrahydromethanopterin reductase-like flavin-dependent oxidoreductase (luciferase family)
MQTDSGPTDGTSRSGAVRVGLRPAHALLEPGRFGDLKSLLIRAEQLGVDHLVTGDHVTFHGGTGFDGLVQATAFALLTERLQVHTSVYLLPLRHPVLVARQISSLTQMAPGRLVFGVGLGGEDREEVRACGIDPGTRGRRMDDCLEILRGLMTGQPVTHHGPFFELDNVRIVPAPSPPVPILIGGRSDAAVRRTARHGEGWLGLWISPTRYATVVDQVERTAAALERQVDWQHGLTVWCGFGPSHEAATSVLAEAMERLYRLPFEKFDRYSPRGRPDDVAAELHPYLGAGCRTFNLIAIAGEPDEALEGVVAVRRILTDPGS